MMDYASNQSENQDMRQKLVSFMNLKYTFPQMSSKALLHAREVVRRREDSSEQNGTVRWQKFCAPQSCAALNGLSIAIRTSGSAFARRDSNGTAKPASIVGAQLSIFNS